MNKNLTPLLPALAALALAIPADARSKNAAAYRAHRIELADVLTPAVKTPDNLVRRYNVFRYPMFKNMAKYADNALPFGWGEPLFFIPEKFVGTGVGEWNVDYEDLLDLGDTVDPAVPGVKWYRLWVGEEVDPDDRTRKWVIATRVKGGNNVGEIIYEREADWDYAPYKGVNGMMRLLGLEPSRSDDGLDVDDDESWFKGLVYWLHDPARYRMAVNLMDYRDWLLLQHAKGKPPGDYTNPGGGMDGGDNNPPPVTTQTTTIPVASLPYFTNQVFGLKAPFIDLYTHTNKLEAYQTYFIVTNATPGTLNVSWKTNNVPAGAYSLPTGKYFETNMWLEARAEIAVHMPTMSMPSSNSYRLYWDREPTVTNTVPVITSLPYSTNMMFGATSPFLDNFTHDSTTPPIPYQTYFFVTNTSSRAINVSWATNNVAAGKYTLPGRQSFTTNTTMHATTRISVLLPPAASTNDQYGLAWWNEWD
jgi:hypothetical protein